MVTQFYNKRQENVEAIMDKVQSIFDNAPYINNFSITIVGGREQFTTVKYAVEETIIPKREPEGETE